MLFKAETKTHSGVCTFNLSPNGSFLAIGDAMGIVKVYSNTHLLLLCQLSSQDTILDLTLSSGSRLYGSRAGYGIVWEPNTLIRLTNNPKCPEINIDALSEVESLAKLSLHPEHLLARVDGIIPLAGQSVGPLYCYGTGPGVAVLAPGVRLGRSTWESWCDQQAACLLTTLRGARMAGYVDVSYFVTT